MSKLRPIRRRAGEAMTRSSAFFKLETPLHSEKEFDDDDVISSSSHHFELKNSGESSSHCQNRESRLLKIFSFACDVTPKPLSG